MIVGRVQEVSNIDSIYSLLTGEHISFIAMPYYVGFKEFILTAPRLVWKSMIVAKRGDNFILRSGNISNLLWFWIILIKKISSIVSR